MGSRTQQLCGLIESRFSSLPFSSLFPHLRPGDEINLVSVSGFGDSLTFVKSAHPFSFISELSYDDLSSTDALSVANPRSLIFDLIKLFLTQVGAKWPAESAGNQQNCSLSLPFSEAIYELITSLDDREKLILSDRLVAGEPKTLDEIGAQLGLTRERVRQIEKKLTEKIGEWVSLSEDMQEFLPLVNGFVGSFTTVINVTEAFPELNVVLEPLGLKGVQLLPVLMSGIELHDRWVFQESQPEQINKFDETFSTHAQGIGYIELRNFSTIFASWGTLSSAELLEWATSRNYKTFEGMVLAPHVNSQSELAIAFLEQSKEPASIEVLCDAVTPGKPKRNLATRLADDPRIVRVGPESWALPEWNIDIYDGIQNVIKRRVEEEGTVSLAVLLEELPSQYGVAPNSVRTYASTYPLQLNGDEVTLASTRKSVNRDVNRVRNLYFVDGKLALRFCINSEHLRGSGIMLSGAFAQAVGVQPGENKQWVLSGHASNFAINWNGGQPRASSIRSLLNDIDAHEGDQVVFFFKDDQLELKKIPINHESLSKDISALCLIPESIELSRKTIAPAIGLPENSVWSQIMELMRLRKDTELLELLEAYVLTLS